MFAKSLTAMRRGVLLTRLDNTSKDATIKFHNRHKPQKVWAPMHSAPMLSFFPSLESPQSPQQQHDVKQQGDFARVPGVCIQATFVVNGWEPGDTIDVFVDNDHLSSVGLSGSQTVAYSKLVTDHRAFKIKACMPPVDVKVAEYSGVTRVC
jgi:hypothetical protein